MPMRMSVAAPRGCPTVAHSEYPQQSGKFGPFAGAEEFEDRLGLISPNPVDRLRH